MTTLITTTLAALVLGFACLHVYSRVQATIPKEHRLKLLMFLMTLAIVVIAMATTGNPLPAVLALIQGLKPTGPSG